MWLEEGGVIVEINAKIKAPMQSVDFEFIKTDISAKVILSSEKIKDVLADLDGSSATVQVKYRPYFKILGLARMKIFLAFLQRPIFILKN